MMFHAPWYALLALAAIPLIAFWFLKLKRPAVELPSLALWRRVMDDARVNAPFQRFRRNLLLWLQLLALLLLVLAAMQPYRLGGDAGAERLPVLIDVSASMGARSGPGEPTALDRAKQRVRALIEALPRNHALCLVAAGDRPRRLTGFTDDRRELRAQLDALTPETTAGDLRAALQLVQAMGRGEPFTRALLVTDGNLPPAVDLELACRLELLRVPGGGPNLGITAAGAQRRGDGRWGVFCAVDASVSAEGGATLELLAGDAVLASERVAPTPGGSRRVEFHLDGAQPTPLRLRLRPDGFDALAADDEAWLPLPAIRPLRVQVAASLPAWRRALAAHPAVVLIDPPGTADLIVSDRGADLAQPALVRFGDGVVPDELAAQVTVAAEGGSAVVDVRPATPILAHVALDDLVIGEQVACSVDQVALERAGWTVLVHGGRGPLLLARERADGVAYHLLFHSARSTLPWRLAFPVLAGNLVQECLRRRGDAEVLARRTGTLPALRAAPDAAVTVDGPAGSVAAIADAEGMVAGVAAPLPGIYRCGAQEVGVALLDARETALSTVDAVQVREVAAVAAGALPAERQWWWWLALGGLVALVIEWWYGHRRPAALEAMR